MDLDQAAISHFCKAQGLLALHIPVASLHTPGRRSSFPCTEGNSVELRQEDAFSDLGSND